MARIRQKPSRVAIAALAEIAYRYSVDGTLMGVRRLTHDAKGRLVLQELYAAARKVAWSLRYVWRDGLLARVNRPKSGGHSWALEWDARGRLAKIAVSRIDQGFAPIPTREAAPARARPPPCARSPRCPTWTTTPVSCRP